MYIRETLSVDEETLSLRHYPTGSEALAVLLHGAGRADQQALQPLAEYLQNWGMDAVSFDYSGHGESSGRALSSVNRKTQQAAQVLARYRSGFRRLHLFAFSMSGQIAVNLLGQFPETASLSLFSPALYTTEAFDMPFDRRFTEVISRPESWRKTNAHAILPHFSGTIALIRPQSDTVIPEGVFEIYRRCPPPERFTEIVLDGAPHTLGAWFGEDIARFAPVFEKLEAQFFS